MSPLHYLRDRAAKNTVPNFVTTLYHESSLTLAEDRDTAMPSPGLVMAAFQMRPVPVPDFAGLTV